MSETTKTTKNLFISTQEKSTLNKTQNKLEFKVDDIFKCPIYLSHKPEWVDDLNKASDPIIKKVEKTWKNRIKDPKDPITHMPNSLHSELIWQYPEFKEMATTVLQQSWNILDQQGYDLRNRIPILNELWVQEFPEGGGFHDIHEHGNNHISGFYFLKCSEKTSFPVFHDPRPGKKMMDLMLKDKNKLNYGNSQVNYKVKPGQFIFFNSYMPHAYVHYSGKEKFRFIHFNVQAVLNQNKMSVTK